MTAHRRRIALTLGPPTRRVLEALAAAREPHSISREIDRLVLERCPRSSADASMSIAIAVDRRRLRELDAAAADAGRRLWSSAMTECGDRPDEALRAALREAPNVADEIVPGDRPRAEWEYGWRRLEREVAERWAAAGGVGDGR